MRHPGVRAVRGGVAPAARPSRRARPRPARTPEYNPELPAKGVTAKMVYDATRPYALRDMFRRARFRDVDPTPWYPDYRER